MNLVIMPRLIPGHHIYHRLADIAWRSYKQYLAGDWQEFPITEHVWQPLWISVFTKCRELSNDHNIFIVGADTIATKPIDVFGKYSQLMMFWRTDPPMKEPYPSYLNSELLYIPQGLSEDLWEIGAGKVREMPGDPQCDYDRIQVIWNDMFWAQVPVPELEPEMHWSPLVASPIEEKDAKIIHFHASRGPDHVLEEMVKRQCA